MAGTFRYAARELDPTNDLRTGPALIRCCFAKINKNNGPIVGLCLAT